MISDAYRLKKPTSDKIYLLVKKSKMKKKRSPRKTTRSKASTAKARSQRRRRKLPIYKRILLHPVALWAMLAIGILLAGLTIAANADDYTVTAIVPAPPLTEAAYITSPIDGQLITSSPTTVIGSCPLNSYVDLIRNGSFSGVATCTADQTFSIITDLDDGNNQLAVQDYNITNQAGPTSPSINVSYQPPVTTTPTSPSGQLSLVTTSQGSNTKSSSAPLVLNSQYTYKSLFTGQTFNWSLNLSGGVAPFFVTTNWGNGESSTLILNSDQTFNISYVYKTSGAYNIVVQIIDSKGVTVVFQITAVIVAQHVAVTHPTVISPIVPKKPNLLTDVANWLKVAWPVYSVVVLMTISFWLGEREEYHIIFKRQRHRNA
jgi:hypothetical protein